MKGFRRRSLWRGSGWNRNPASVETRILRTLALLTTLLPICTARAAEPPLMRYPNTSATAIAFVPHGTLWTAPLAGGPARRLVDDADGILVPRSRQISAGSPIPPAIAAPATCSWWPPTVAPDLLTFGALWSRVGLGKMRP